MRETQALFIDSGFYWFNTGPGLYTVRPDSYLKYSMTTLGLLETDTLYDDLRAEYGSYGQMFARYFDGLEGGLQYRYYDVQNLQLPEHVDECDAYLITGSKAGVYDSDPWISRLQTWIADFHQRGAKIIGICFGHQILAHSLGGLAAKSDKGWGVGVHSTTLLPDDELTISSDKADPQNSRQNSEQSSHRGKLSLIYSHQDQVQKLPPGAQLLASSDFCRYAAFKIDDRILSFQGHPEFTPEYLQRLLHRRKQAIGEARYAKAIASLGKPTDEQSVGRRLLDFIHHEPL